LVLQILNVNIKALLEDSQIYYDNLKKETIKSVNLMVKFDKFYEKNA